MDFSKLLQEATLAANAAGDKWMQEVGRDCCGISFVEVTDKRTKFARWLKKTTNDRYLVSVPINHKYRGAQDWGLREACAYAAYKVLKDAGVTGIRVWSRID